MRKFLVSAAIIGLIMGSPAFAQDHHDQGGGHGEPHGGGAPHGGPGGGEPHGGPAPQQHAAPAPRPAMQAAPERGGPPRGGEMRGPQQARPEPNRPAPNNAMRGPGPERPANNNAMRGPQGRPGPNNAMRGPARDFSSVRNYHQNFQATRRFHAPAYVRPSGFYQRRWAWGMTLPALFWARQYWLTDYVVYDLPPPPFGAVWVRVGDDALLIDQYSGMIIEVDYGVFY